MFNLAKKRVLYLSTSINRNHREELLWMGPKECK